MPIPVQRCKGSRAGNPWAPVVDVVDDDDHDEGLLFFVVSELCWLSCEEVRVVQERWHNRPIMAWVGLVMRQKLCCFG